ncbi:hypothetical protein ZIOFF_020116 [Zingiber officinale]|uniref:VQ domain-containing protein n=1 Tax=Zingiber officinale TaxID=94328 RepID=A0A8J5LNH9_ZINOF|nr:hypothetical protein ZIOFF_020116 [Zingiber officinale]
MEGGEERNMEWRNSSRKKKKSDPAEEVAGDKSKKMKQPFKVVYISNPMKVKATVDEFRSVVQGLTGRDSDLESSLSKYGDDGPPELPEAEACDGSAGADLSGEASAKQVGECDHFEDDDDELPEFLPSPPAYFELQGNPRVFTRWKATILNLQRSAVVGMQECTVAIAAVPSTSDNTTLLPHDKHSTKVAVGCSNRRQAAVGAVGGGSRSLDGDNKRLAVANGQQQMPSKMTTNSWMVAVRDSLVAAVLSAAAGKDGRGRGEKHGGAEQQQQEEERPSRRGRRGSPAGTLTSIESSLSKYGDDGPPELPEAEACDGSGSADLSGEASTKQVGEYDHFDDDEEELPEFLPSPPAYFELQGHIHFRH